MTDDQSDTALEADKLQERLVKRERKHQFWGLIAILAIGVGIAVWRNVAAVYIFAGIAAWVVLSLHISFTAMLHELYELNDQIAGRKDEFKRMIQQRR